MTTASSLKLPENLRQRIAPLAEAAGQTLRAWMIEALESQVAKAEARQLSLRAAEDSAAEVDAGGALYAAEDVAAYLRARGAGKAATRPKRIPRRATGAASASTIRRR